jgi:hypothetical protein
MLMLRSKQPGSVGHALRKLQDGLCRHGKRELHLGVALIILAQLWLMRTWVL